MDHRPVLTTERLLLRPFSPEEAHEVARPCADREIASTTRQVPHPSSLEEARSFIRSQEDARAKGTGAVFAVTLRETGELLGAAGFRREGEHRRGELGYRIATGHWNRGYAAESVQAVGRFGFEDLGLPRIHGSHLERNPAWGRLLLKAGLDGEGTLRDPVFKRSACENSRRFGMARSREGEGTR